MGPKKGGKKKKDGDQADAGGGAESADQVIFYNPIFLLNLKVQIR